MKTPLLPPLLIMNCSSRRKSLYSFSVLNHEPVFSGFVDQLIPYRPTRMPFSMVHSPSSILVQPVRSLPLKTGTHLDCSSATHFRTCNVLRMASYSPSSFPPED